MNVQALVKQLDSGPLDDHELDAINARMGGMERTLGIRYTHLSRAGVRAELEIGPHILQSFGLVNGGTFCTIAECVGSFAGCLAANAPVVGLTNTTHFLSPGTSGVIQAQAHPVHLGKRVQLWEVECSVGEKLLAVTSLRAMVMAGVQ
ncbi:PaaI family thioesterase [Corynebacterium sp.]|uniref:PaaI family thioesterase n=1 Tax=Corynebacterium sp. TaxID=1720 RepID=UPI0026DDB7B9|nr:PaaI family thioesterase [Corynebacterium sp.]MDO5077360.1 PaaI family thioesterase [Corynebacterium sp.]